MNKKCDSIFYYEAIFLSNIYLEYFTLHLEKDIEIFPFITIETKIITILQILSTITFPGK